MNPYSINPPPPRLALSLFLKFHLQIPKIRNYFVIGKLHEVTNSKIFLCHLFQQNNVSAELLGSPDVFPPTTL